MKSYLGLYSSFMARSWDILARPFVGHGGKRMRLKVRQAGLTLIEIIIVVALLGTLMTILVRSLTGRQDQAMKDQSKIAMGQLGNDLQLYKIHTHKYPTTEQGLNALLVAPGDSKTWKGPYAEKNRLNDPWGTQFGYESDGVHFKLRSGGPDQQLGTADDITYPEEEDAAGATAGSK